MKIGKLSESALQKVVFEQLHTRRDEVLVGPGIGEDCAALKLQEVSGSICPFQTG